MSFKESIIAAGLDEERLIKGISDIQISEIEQVNNVILPTSYKFFLKECGRSAGLFLCDIKFFYPAILRLKVELEEMISEIDSKFYLPHNAFVFCAYQGYQYHYFLCDRNADPEIYGIIDDGREPEIISPSFTFYIERGIEQYKCAYVNPD